MKLLSLQDEDITITTDEIISAKEAIIVSDALKHKLYGETSYTVEQKVKALEAALKLSIEQKTFDELEPCQCEAHLELANKSSVLKPHIVKLLDIAASAANPDVVSQVADVIICILEIFCYVSKVQGHVRW